MKNYTDLNIILDRSGSMTFIAGDMVGGIKAFLEKERQTGDETKVSLYQFDNVFETVFVDVDIGKCPDITLYPRGGTALRDALGRTIALVGEKLAKMDEADRPNRVLLLVITDGHENASKEFTRNAVADSIKHQREKYAWDFVFLGTDEAGVLAQHKDFAISANSTRGFTRSPDGIKNVFESVSNNYQMYKKLDRTDVATYCQTFEFEPDGK